MRIQAIVVTALLASLAIAPAGAFEAGSLDVTVGPRGPVEVTMIYDLTLVERLGFYAAMAAPGRALERALSALLLRPVRVREVEPGRAAFTVPRFATVAHGRDGTVYATPAVDFTAFGRDLDRHWFRPLASPNFLPRTITLTFPDGYAERFDDRTGLPKVMHRA